MRANTSTIIRINVIYVLILIAVSGCANLQPPPTPTAPPAPTQPVTAPTVAAPTAPPATNAAPTAENRSDEKATKAGIQQAVDRYAQAYSDNDPDLLTQAVDQTNAPFRRLVRGRFDNFQQSLLARQVQFDFRVLSVRQRDLGFVEARIERAGDGSVADWLFRQVDGRWVLSEPTEAQIGKREEIETEHFTFYSYPWAEDVTPKLIELMEQSRDTVAEKLGKTPDRKANVYVYPVFGIGQPEDPGTLAYYRRPSNPRMPDRIVIFAPQSYSFGFYDPNVGWEGDLEATLTHEYTHLVNNRSFIPLARMRDWMSEGLAEYVAGSPRASEVSEAVRTDNIIPIIDTSGRIDKQDLEHIYILEKDVSLAYGLSYSLVAYIAETYGGLDGFWKLMDAFDKAQNFDKALQQAFGVTYDEFDSGWRAWLKETY
jgi:hypothetical protein